MIKKLLRILSLTVCFSLFASCIVFANAETATLDPVETETVYINGEVFLLKTYISDTGDDVKSEDLTRGTITRTKTSNLYNSSGEIMISVSVTGTFYYNGSSATCTSCSGSSTSYSSAWQITDYYVSRSGNSATNYTTAVQNNTYTYHKNVTISCSADGTVY